MLRATAIVLVLFSHSSHLLIPASQFIPWFPSIDGVDLFFVLSGFLVGGLLLKMNDEPGTPWRSRLLDFWQRRWLRTLPNYYFFLVLNIALVAAGLVPGLISSATGYYAVFMQNFHEPLDLFFWESWSLAVEEWFYLTFPLLLIALVTLLRVPFMRAFLFCVAVYCIAPLIVRLITIDATLSPTLFDIHVRKLVITRLDAIGVGALTVWLSMVFPQRWSAWRWPAFAIGIVGLIAFSLHRPTVADLYGAFYFSGEVLAIACLLPVLSSWKTSALLGRPVVFLSKIAYALYLVHLPVLHLFHRFVPQSEQPDPWITLFYWAACVLAATAVLYLIESPFMRMRDRLGRRIRRS